MDENFTKAIGQNVSGGPSISVTDLGHLDLALESPPNSVIDTMRFSPVWLSKF